MKYPCSVCGSCCLQIGKVVISAIAALDQADKDKSEIHPILEELASFPYDILESGACSKLKDGLCTVYETRPLICNTDKMYKKYWAAVMTEKDYHLQSLKSCAKLQGRLKHGDSTGNN